MSTSTSTVYHNDSISPQEKIWTIHYLGYSHNVELIIITLINDEFSYTPVPQVPYYVRVAALTVKGRGLYSDAVVNFTRQGSKYFVVLYESFTYV